MRILAAVALAASLSGFQQAPAQSPQECVKAGRDFASQKQRESAPLTSEKIRAIDAERIEMVKGCGARFDVEKATTAELAGLAEFYLATSQRDLAHRAIERGLAAQTTATERADILVTAVRLLLQQPKSAQRNAKAEAYVTELDALPDAVLDQKASAHISMNGYYRADDIDEGIIRHSKWLIDTAKTMTPEQRRKFGPAIVSAYSNMAEALAGQGMNDEAIALLRRGPAEWPEIPNAADRLGDTLARYMLVGTAAPSIAAPQWLNREATAPLDLKGKVTLLQFTAHWCGPCKESYPGMNRLRERFKDRPFQVVFATRTYGYFEAERNLTRDQEIAKDKAYFAGYGFDIPIAIGPEMFTMVDGKRVVTEDPVETGFGVSGIPQINVIDAKGNIRLIMIGYDDANEEKLAAFIEKVLAEK